MLKRFLKKLKVKTEILNLYIENTTLFTQIGYVPCFDPLFASGKVLLFQSSIT